RARGAVVPRDEETAVRSAPRAGRLLLGAAKGRAADRAGHAALAAAARREPAVGHERIHRVRAEEDAPRAARIPFRAARLPRADERRVPLRLAVAETREHALHDMLALTHLVVRGNDRDRDRLPAENRRAELRLRRLPRVQRTAILVQRTRSGTEIDGAR